MNLLLKTDLQSPCPISPAENLRGRNKSVKQKSQIQVLSWRSTKEWSRPRECWAPELAGHSALADYYHTDRWTPGLPTVPNFLVKVKIPNIYLNLSMSTYHPKTWNMAAWPTENVDGVCPLRKTCGQTGQTHWCCWKSQIYMAFREVRKVVMT